MALLWIDGFDAYGQDGHDATSLLYSSGYGDSKQAGLGTTTGVASADTRTGVGFSMKSYNNWGNTSYVSGFLRSFPVATSIVFGFALKATNSTFAPIAKVVFNNLLGLIVDQLILYINGEAGLTCTTGDGDLVAATPPNVVFPGLWQYMEVKYAPSATNGSLQVKIDGVLVINVSAAKTSEAASPPTCNGLAFAQMALNITLIDDFYLCDETGSSFNDFLGDVVVHSIFPNADAGPNTMAQFGGGVGHFTSVDEQTPDDDGSYTYSDTSGQQEMFALSTFPTDIIDVLAVAVNVRARKDAAGLGTYEICLAYGGNETDSGALPANIGYIEQQFILIAPPGGGTWTKTIAQASTVGFKIP